MSDDLDILLNKYMEQEKIHRIETPKAVEKIAKAIGYGSSTFGPGAIDELLEDNPGACEAIVNWILEQNCSEWREKVQEQLHTEAGDDDVDEA